MILSIQLVYLALVVSSIAARGHAAYILNVRVHSYLGDDKCPVCVEFARPGCCDNFSNTRTCTGNDRCDNTFFYCLRDFGTVTSLNTAGSERCGTNDKFGKLSGINVDSAPLNFSQDNVLGLPNPIPLRGPTIPWQGVQLYVEVTDADYGNSGQFIDRFTININKIPIGNETTPTVYNGTFGFSSLTLSFRVDCFISHFFPYCTPDGCQNFGNCTCFPGYNGEDCEYDINECEEANCPENTICVDEINSYTCKPMVSDGGGQDFCRGMSCSDNGSCENRINSFLCVCDLGYTGDQCETIISHITTNTVITANSGGLSKSHVTLCIVAVILVVMVVAVIVTIQSVLIGKSNRVKTPGLPNNNYDYAMPVPNSDIETNQSALKATGDQSNAGSTDLEENAAPQDEAIPMEHNPGYNLPPGSHAVQNTNQQAVRPTAEHEQYASTIPNTHRGRPRKLPINIYDYETCIPSSGVERDLLSSSTSEHSTSESEALGEVSSESQNTCDAPSPEAKTDSPSDSQNESSSSPFSEAEVDSGFSPLESGNDDSEFNEYFLAGAILTIHNTSYSLPMDHSAQARPEHTSAPTPEHEAFISTWTKTTPSPHEAAGDLQNPTRKPEVVSTPTFKIKETPV